MYIQSLVLAAGLLALTGCAGNVTIPSPGFNHPANPQAAAAPLPSPPIVPKAQKVMADMQAMEGMNHGSMQGLDHGSMKGMDGMNMAEGGMEGMDHGSMNGMNRGDMQGMEDGSMKGKDDMEGMQREGYGASEHGDEHGPSAAGEPGDESQVDRTLEVTAMDTMSYEPQSLTVKPGETIRFIVTNAGKMRHEFVIGTTEEQREHEQMMARMPNMVHEDPNSVTLEPGETKTLVWQFSNSGVVEFACHVPGHYPAGMIGKVQVGTARAAGEHQMEMKMDDMQGMDHGSMKSMESMKGMSEMKNMENMEGMEGERHAH